MMPALCLWGLQGLILSPSGSVCLVLLQVAHANKLRARITEHVERLLGNDGVLALPSAPGPAPLLNTPQQDLNVFRQRLISLTCIAGLSALPQVWQKLA